MIVVSIVSAKGGVGKTTLAANLASIFASQGRRVLAIDADPQNALRLHFGVTADDNEGWARAVLARTHWQAAMRNGHDGVTVLPYGVVHDDDQRRFEAHLDAHPEILRLKFDTLGLAPGDIVLIDTPTGASPTTRAALQAATFALHVLHADAASYAAIAQMTRLVERHAAQRADFAGFGYLVNAHDAIRPLSKDMLKVLREDLREQLFPGVIHADEGLAEALAYGTTLNHYDPPSRAASDLRACAAWLREAAEQLSGETA
jgi:chromosome partitioning protein